MGCLFFPLELLVDDIIEGWFFLMEWIIPERYLSRTFRTVLRILVWVFSALLLFIMLLGFFALISDDIYVRQIGKYMLFIPLGISAVQIIFGIIVRIVSKRKKEAQSGEFQKMQPHILILVTMMLLGINILFYIFLR